MNNAAALSEAKTVERFERQETQRSKSGYAFTKEFAAVIDDSLAIRLADCIRADAAGLRRYGLGFVDPKNLACAGLSSLLHSILRGTEEPALRIDIGRWLLAARFDAGLTPKQRKSIQRGGKTKARVAVAKQLGFNSKEWSNAQKVKVGNWFINCCLRALPDVFAGRGRRGIFIRDDARETIGAIRERLMLANPFIVPCTEIPEPWTDLYKGGFSPLYSRIIALATPIHATHRFSQSGRSLHIACTNQSRCGVAAHDLIALAAKVRCLRLKARNLPRRNRAVYSVSYGAGFVSREETNVGRDIGRVCFRRLAPVRCF